MTVHEITVKQGVQLTQTKKYKLEDNLVKHGLRLTQTVTFYGSWSGTALAIRPQYRRGLSNLTIVEPTNEKPFGVDYTSSLVRGKPPADRYNVYNFDTLDEYIASDHEAILTRGLEEYFFWLDKIYALYGWVKPNEFQRYLPDLTNDNLLAKTQHIPYVWDGSQFVPDEDDLYPKRDGSDVSYETVLRDWDYSRLLGYPWHIIDYMKQIRVRLQDMLCNRLKFTEIHNSRPYNILDSNIHRDITIPSADENASKKTEQAYPLFDGENSDSLWPNHTDNLGENGKWSRHIFANMLGSFPAPSSLANFACTTTINAYKKIYMYDNTATSVNDAVVSTPFKDILSQIQHTNIRGQGPRLGPSNNLVIDGSVHKVGGYLNCSIARVSGKELIELDYEYNELAAYFYDLNGRSITDAWGIIELVNEVVWTQFETPFDTKNSFGVEFPGLFSDLFDGAEILVGGYSGITLNPSNETSANYTETITNGVYSEIASELRDKKFRQLYNLLDDTLVNIGTFDIVYGVGNPIRIIGNKTGLESILNTPFDVFCIVLRLKPALSLQELSWKDIYDTVGGRYDMHHRQNILIQRRNFIDTSWGEPASLESKRYRWFTHLGNFDLRMPVTWIT